MRRLKRTFLLVLASCCVSLVVSGQPYLEYVQGDYPLILSAPHGGYLTPGSIKDRTCSACVTIRDTRTQEWARLLSDEIFARTGRRPYVVINLLSRTKLDPNRDVAEAADGDPGAAAVWTEYHAALDAAAADIELRFGGGLLIDLHGHGHSVLRFELGYLMSAAQLRLPDADLDARSERSSVAALSARSASLSTLLTGPDSMGEMLVRSGVPAVPSMSDPAPVPGDAYFSGGYITARHGSQFGGTVDAIQFESHYTGARNSDGNLETLARDVGGAVVQYMDTWYADATGTGVSLEPAGANLGGEQECLSVQANEGHIQVRIRCNSGRTVHVRLVDLLGRTRQVVTGTGDLKLDSGQLAAGMYFVVVEGQVRAMPVAVR
ncbi:MAG: hypothetical protein ACI80V_003352 [Rhodothermales bacterium]|jgi:hypothetical protein